MKKNQLSVYAVVILVGMFAVSLEAQNYSKLVTIGGSVTEIVYSLGAGKEVVGVDETSIYPPEAKKLPKVGVLRNLSLEGILSLRPDIVISLYDAGNTEVLQQVQNAGIKTLIIPNEHTIAGARKKIQLVGEALGLQKKARELTAQLDRDVAQLKIKAESKKNKPRVLFIYAHGQAVVNASGTNTAANEMIQLAGGINAVTGYEGYKPLTAESVVASRPDIILVTKAGFQSVGGIAGIKKIPGVELTNAGKASNIVVVDDLLLLGFSPRVMEGVRYLHLKFFPDRR